MLRLFFFFSIFGIALSSAAQKNDYVKRSKALQGRFQIYVNESKPDSLNFVAKDMIELAFESKNDTLLSDAYNNLALYFSGVSDFSSALDYQFKALQISEQLNDSVGIGMCLSNISFTFHQIGNYAKGVEFASRASSVWKSLDHIRNEFVFYYYHLSNSYDNAAISYIMLSKPDSAILFLNKGLAALTKSRLDIYYNLYLKQAITTDLARTYQVLNENMAADSLFRHSIRSSDSIGIIPQKIYGTMYYLKFLAANKRFAEVLSIGLPVMKLAVDSKDLLNIISIAASLQEAYYFFGNVDSAYFYSNLVNECRNRVYNNRNLAGIQNAVFNRQIMENEQELQRKKDAQERQNWIQVMIIAMSIMIFVVLFILFSHSVYAGPSLIRFVGVLNLLIVFEFINLLTDPFLADITHHSPVLMLVVKVALASLLIPVHHKLEHLISHYLVEKNNSIRSKKSGIK